VQFLNGWRGSAQGKGLYRNSPPGENPDLDQAEIRAIAGNPNEVSDAAVFENS